jgi:hypothetical protein
MSPIIALSPCPLPILSLSLSLSLSQVVALDFSKISPMLLAVGQANGDVRTSTRTCRPSLIFTTLLRKPSSTVLFFVI